ncbi:hypothetical protein NE865_06324 [Phthorimaea operculella]|nr:hypothetical protein NE865_06324 [Phthorimaea operculella]
MTQAATSRNMESLPKQFVSAMRTLFDIMDDKHTGILKPTLESLQKVASHDGLLTFERFCTGLKICLLQNQVQSSSKKTDRHEDVESSVMQTQINAQMHRPPSAPLLDINDAPNHERNWNGLNNTENTSQQRTISMPQLIARKDVPIQDLRQHGSVSISKHEHRVYGPPKPPRLEKSAAERKESSRSSYKSEEETAFDSEGVADVKMTFEEISQAVEEHSRGLGDGRPANETQPSSTMRRTNRRREPRRHTLHNGIDYNLLKRMKQIEQEKDVLLQGLSAVEEAREWYLKQLSEVQEKMRYAGRMGAYVEPWSEAHQERLELLRARVLELNRQLGALAAGWRHGPLSLHMNLAFPVAPQPGAPKNATVLRSQNRMLAEEVNRKNERISMLEREKSSLIRELLLQRNRTKIMDNFS